MIKRSVGRRNHIIILLPARYLLKPASSFTVLVSTYGRPCRSARPAHFAPHPGPRGPHGPPEAPLYPGRRRQIDRGRRRPEAPNSWRENRCPGTGF